MEIWILYKRNENELIESDHGVLRLCEEAKKRNMHVRVFRPDQFDLFSSDISHQTVILDGHACALPDWVIPRMGAETSSLLIALLRQFEWMNVRVCNTLEAILSVKDKFLMTQKMTAAEIPCPKSWYCKLPYSAELLASQFQFPLVMKTLSGARGFGIFLCHSKLQLRDLIDFLISHNERGFLVQEFIGHRPGCDVRVFVIGERVIGCMQRIAAEGFKANFSLGGRVEPYQLTEEIEGLALRTAKLFGLEITGIDLLFTENGFTVCEANSSPGFKGLEQALNINVANQILDYLHST